MCSRGPILLLLTFVCGAAAVRAQAPAMERVAFREAIERAIERNPSAAIAAAGIVSAEALLRQTRSSILPSATANVTSTTLNRSTEFDGTTVTPRSQVTGNLDVRMPPRETPNDARPVEEVDPQVAAHQQVTDLTPARPLRVARGSFRLSDQRPGVSEEHPARIGQLHMTLRTIEKSRLQLTLETPDLLTQRWLGDMESGGRTPEMQLLGHRGAAVARREVPVRELRGDPLAGAPDE